MAINIIKLKEFAEQIGVSSARVRAMIGQGILDDAIVERPEKNRMPYKLDKDKAEECIRKYLSPKHDSQVMACRGKASDGLTDRDRLIKTQIRKETAITKIKELDLAEKSGKLINSEKVRECAFDAARQVRDSMLNIPDRVSAILSSERDEIKVREILTREIREALKELVNNGST